MKASESFFSFLAKWEGEKLCPYKDLAGVPTIGIGSTFYEDGTKVRMTDSCISHDRAVQIAKHVIVDFENEVTALAPGVNQNQFDALLDFAYNEGDGALRTSTLLKRVKSGADKQSITDAFMMWVKVRDPKTGILKTSDWQVKRRTAEADLYFKPVA